MDRIQRTSRALTSRLGAKPPAATSYTLHSGRTWLHKEKVEGKPGGRISDHIKQDFGNFDNFRNNSATHEKR